MKSIRIFATFSGLVAVALGAMGSHALNGKVSEQAASQFETGVNYQFFHTLALLAVIILDQSRPGWGWKWPAWCFTAGIILFSGSLYLLATREISGLTSIGKFLWPVTPAGGLLLMAGWFLLLVIFIKKRTHE